MLPNIIPELEKICSDSFLTSTEHVEITRTNSTITLHLIEMAAEASALGDIQVTGATSPCTLVLGDTVIDILKEGKFQRFTSLHPFPLCCLGNQTLKIVCKDTITIQAVAIKFNDVQLRMMSWKFPLHLPLGIQNPMITFDPIHGLQTTHTFAIDDRRIQFTSESF